MCIYQDSSDTWLLRVRGSVFGDLHKSARQFSRGSGGAVLKKRKTSECECLWVMDIYVLALVAQLTYVIPLAL